MNLKADFPEKDLFVKLFGENVYAVGGYVRDLLMGIHSKDVDILITKHTVDEIVNKISKYGRVDLVGKSFGVIKFTTKGRTYDVSLPRTEVLDESRKKDHKNFIISADPNLPIEKDLERRDFRCNSIALRLIDGKIIDPFNGQKDIKEKIIRITNPKTFPDDPLRVLRIARFASILNFRVDPELYYISQRIDLKGLSVERINEELFKILLLSDRPSIGLKEFFKLGVLYQLFPELYKLTLTIQDSVFHPEKDEFGHHTVWHHTLITVDQAKRLCKKFNLSEEKSLALLLAALYHDVGKSETAKWEYKNGRMVITNNRHDVIGAKITEEVFNRFKIYSWNGYDLRKMVLILVRTHHRSTDLWQNRHNVTRRAFNRLAADVEGEIELLILLDAADRAGRYEELIDDLDEQGKWLFKKFEELRVSKETIKPLVMGRDLLKLGFSPGPKLGKILKKLYEMQLDNEFQTKEEGIKLASKVSKELFGKEKV
ncbi:HD domain-containing protein [Candidatus Aminicenantes bacterium AC-335-A11]|jgi:tRNA nucleotidyltransferase (CCA-adding enzyme)|nr:HD domain-containing protein [SCandidatus Aminicenantes bacterium Aminicenantia_JdfR_composite]MCP2596321.1 HD domain-containing protein [Candidatus Aminicenantes bacterium AC-335-G13]MCP2617795.1 HD domain-containing protein [Candidatus Aminicenantes bacterium AC-335-A11]